MPAIGFLVAGLSAATTSPAVVAAVTADAGWSAQPLAGAGTAPAGAGPEPVCDGRVCTLRLTARQLLDRAAGLVAEKRYDEARPVLAALAAAPETAAETHFLSGLVAAQTGDADRAIHEYRASLAGKPDQARTRVELASLLMQRGEDGAADYHYRLAQQDRTLPREVRAMISHNRDLLRGRRNWQVTTRVGIAPDTNINNGTDAQAVNVEMFGAQIPMELDKQARRRSGVGQTGSISGSLRVRARHKVGMLIEASAGGINYRGKQVDDFSADFAAGPELRFGRSQVSVQAVAGQRWYGGSRAHREIGAKVNFERRMGRSGQMTMTLDANKHFSDLSDDMMGRTVGASLGYERVVGKAYLANINVFARRDRKRASIYSNREIGMAMGLGGELPHGLNAGLSVQVARARYDAPMLIFSTHRRHDVRFAAQAQVGLRTVRFAGFSPSVTVTHMRAISSLKLYSNRRTRLSFTLARYF